MVIPHDKPLQAGDRFPYLFLTSAPDGSRQELRAKTGCSAVVLLLHDVHCAPCQSYARQIALARGALQEWDGQILMVLADSLAAATRWQEQLREHSGAPVLALADPEQRTAGRCGVQVPALLIADQWGVLYFVEEAGSEHRFSAPAEVVDWARFVAIQCPECQAEAL